MRDVIYELAFRVPGAIFIFDKEPSRHQALIRGTIVKYKDAGPSEPQRVGKRVPIALMRTCKQVHVESSDVLYGRNVFQMFMARVNFSATYDPLVRSIVFMIEPDHRIYADDLDTVGYWWKRRVWTDIVDRSMTLLNRFPNLKSLTFPIKSGRLGSKFGITWRPAFLAWENKTREQRISLAAAWMRAKCSFANDRMREVLHLELVPAPSILKDELVGSRFILEEDDDEWSPEEFYEAFEKMKTL